MHSEERESGYPEIKYKLGDVEISLHRASSTVSELAPLFLYLKYYPRKGSVLIVEEPEAHLHLRNIRILAQLLVCLRRQGINLILTTHSEYLLEQLRNFIMLETVSREDRESKYGYGKDDFLQAEEVGLHIFKPDRRSKGYRIKSLEVTPENGIAEEGFIEVHDQLYDETARLERDFLSPAHRCAVP